jgi:hypothetical protein
MKNKADEVGGTAYKEGNTRMEKIFDKYFQGGKLTEKEF